jgi:phosphinothricin acetyltransferase
MDDSSNVQIRLAEHGDLPAIFAILNREIEEGINIFETRPIEGPAQQAWWAAHPAHRYPVFVALDHRALIGWASLSAYSVFCGYSGTAEVSIWLDPSRQGRGIGSMLYERLLSTGSELGIRVVLARVESQNQASARLHRRFGFREVGTLRRVGEKFGRLLDVTLLEKQLGPAG